MISRTAPDPLSMKTTPRLFECDPKGSPSSPFSSTGGGLVQQIKLESKKVTVPSPRVPALEWADLQGQLPEGGI